jgi:isopenicillin-N epimerase
VEASFVNEIRAQMPLLQSCIFLNNGSDGPQPAKAQGAFIQTQRFLEEGCLFWPELGPKKSERYYRLKQKVAGLMGTRPGQLALMRSVSEGISMVANGFQWLPGDEVVISDEEHESNLLPWIEMAKRYGVVLRAVKLYGDEGSLLERFASTISDKTRLIAVSHITCETGYHLPMQELCSLARERSIPVLVDGGQAFGQVPVNVEDMGCDFYLAPGYKWILGSSATAFLYLRDDWTERLSTSAWGDKMQTSLDRSSYSYEPRPGTGRFEYGNKSLPLYSVTEGSIDFLMSIGLDQIYAQIAGNREYLHGLLRDHDGIKFLSRGKYSRPSGILTIAIPGLSGDTIVQQLWEEAKVVVRSTHRGGGHEKGETGVRLCTGFYNTKEELEQVAGILLACASSR